MLGMLGSVFFLFLLAGGVSGLRWSDKLRQDAGPIQVCSGENIQLFWNFTLNKGERLKGMVWGCQPEGKEDGVLATYVDDHFVPTSSFSGRLAHLQGGGIELSCATILESGNYSVAVTTEDVSNSLTVHRKTVSVTVLDPPKTMSGEVQVTRKEEAVRDVTTGEWHVQLSCGNFSDRGHPPVDVIWTTPKGDHLSSTNYQDGFFHLLLPNPLVGGKYGCEIPDSQPAVTCLPQDSPLLEGLSSVEVDHTAGRFALLEARQQEFVEKLTEERNSWMGVVEGMTNRTAALEQWRDETHVDTSPVSFHARLTSNSRFYNSILKLTNVINNQGQGYDPSTGYFTAPKNGTYFFIGTTAPYDSGSNANMKLMFEGTAVAETKLKLYSSHYAMGSCHAALYMEAGQKVWLQSGYDTYNNKNYFHGATTAFTGFCIQ